MQNDWYFIGLYHTQLNYAEWLILYWLYHTQLNYAEWLILYWIVPYSTKLCRMIDTLLDCTVSGLYHTQLNYAEWLIL